MVMSPLLAILARGFLSFQLLKTIFHVSLSAFKGSRSWDVPFSSGRIRKWMYSGTMSTALHVDPQVPRQCAGAGWVQNSGDLGSVADVASLCCSLLQPRCQDANPGSWLTARSVWSFLGQTEGEFQQLVGTKGFSATTTPALLPFGFPRNAGWPFLK